MFVSDEREQLMRRSNPDLNIRPPPTDCPLHLSTIFNDSATSDLREGDALYVALLLSRPPPVVAVISARNGGTIGTLAGDAVNATTLRE